jgi:hypothetical protein
MSVDAYRRERLRRLVDLARAYRGWTNTELAAALGRDARNVYSQSGNPKYDYLRGLARALEWSIEDVARFIEGGAPSDISGGDETFESLNETANRLMATGRFEEMIEVARKMYLVATSADDRARACNRQASGWNRLGRYEQFLECLRLGIDQSNIATSLRLVLHSNLAIGYFRIWDLSSANGVAHALIDRLTDRDLPSKREHSALAFAHYPGLFTSRYGVE